MSEAQHTQALRNPIWDFFHSLPVLELQTQIEGQSTKKPMITTLTTANTVEDAVRAFSAQGILSAPVLDKSTTKLVGFVDMLDIAHFLLKVVPGDQQIQMEDLASLKMAGRAMALKELQEVVNASGRDPPYPVQLKSPCSQLVDLFATGQHRAPLFDHDETKVIGLVSQSDLIRRLVSDIGRGKLKPVGERTIESLGLGQGQGLATAVVNKASVLDLIRQLDQEHVSAVGLVEEAADEGGEETLDKGGKGAGDSGGKLVGNFSVTDLRGLWEETWPHFVLTAEEYLQKHHPESLKIKGIPLANTTLAQVVLMMVEQRVHRIWTVDEAGKPIGVVSMTDVMKIVRDLEMMV